MGKKSKHHSQSRSKERRSHSKHHSHSKSQSSSHSRSRHKHKHHKKKSRLRKRRHSSLSSERESVEVSIATTDLKTVLGLSDSDLELCSSHGNNDTPTLSSAMVNSKPNQDRLGPPNQDSFDVGHCNQDTNNEVTTTSHEHLLMKKESGSPPIPKDATCDPMLDPLVDRSSPIHDNLLRSKTLSSKSSRRHQSRSQSRSQSCSQSLHENSSNSLHERRSRSKSPSSTVRGSKSQRRHQSKSPSRRRYQSRSPSRRRYQSRSPSRRRYQSRSPSRRHRSRLHSVRQYQSRSRYKRQDQSRSPSKKQQSRSPSKKQQSRSQLRRQRRSRSPSRRHRSKSSISHSSLSSHTCLRSPSRHQLSSRRQSSSRSWSSSKSSSPSRSRSPSKRLPPSCDKTPLLTHNQSKHTRKSKLRKKLSSSTVSSSQSAEKTSIDQPSVYKDQTLKAYTQFCTELSASSLYNPLLSTAAQCATELASSALSSQLTQETSYLYRDPFTSVQQKPNLNLVFHNNVWKTPTQAVLDGVPAQSLPPVQSFPVSDGRDHSTLDPTDDHSQVSAPFGAGLYTGVVTLRPIEREEHQKGFQAWTKKNMFQNLKPVQGGFGEIMLKKMGWKAGTPLGKTGTGHVEPVAEPVKLDRKGLSGGPVVPLVTTSGNVDTPLQVSTPMCTAGVYAGKHPVSALHELSTRKRWEVQYDMVECAGPAHLRQFKFKVTTPLGAFVPDKLCASKKEAKAEAALLCLTKIGLAQS